MSAPEDDIADPLHDAYRRASAAEAGRPADATRAAILAEARAAAAARAASSPPKPAANEPWFSWRMAASLVVVGVALIVWRQLPRGATQMLEAPSAPVATIAPAQDAPPARTAVPLAEKPEGPPPARDDTALADAAGAAQAASAASARRADRRLEKSMEAPTTASVTDRPLPAPAPALASASATATTPVIVDLNAKEPVPESQSTAVTPLRRLPEGMVLRRSEPKPDFGALVRRDFPGLPEDARPPVGVWLLLDFSGRTLKSGTLDRGQTLGSVLTSLQREFPDRRLRPFDTGIVRIQNGATVLVGVARAD